MIIGADVIVTEANDHGNHAKPLRAETIPTAKTASRLQFKKKFVSQEEKFLSKWDFGEIRKPEMG
jgi:hypothetical protein